MTNGLMKGFEESIITCHNDIDSMKVRKVEKVMVMIR